MANRNAKAGFRGGRDNGAIQENMELLTGQRGNGLDRAITIRELAQLGLINVSRNSNGSVIPKPVPPTFPDDKPVDIPHAPVGFAAFGGFGAIMLEWKNPTFNGFAHAELWRAAPNVDNSAPNLDQAVLIATTPATVFGDIVNPGSTFYYWCRFVNVNNISGPYSDVDGVKVSTSPNIGDIIDDIGEQMKDSELVQGLITDISEGDKAAQEAINAAKDELAAADKTLQGSIDAAKDELAAADKTLQGSIDAAKDELAATDKTLQESIDAAKDELATADDLLAGVIAKVEVDYKKGDAEAHASIKELEQAVTTDDNVLAQQISQLDAAFKTANESATLTTNAKITTVNKVLVSADEALALSIKELDAAYKEADKVTGEAIKEVNANITEMDKVLTNTDKALAESVKKIEADYKTADNSLSGSISDLSQVVATADQALAQKISKIETEYKSADVVTNAAVTSLTKTVSTGDHALAERIDGLKAQWQSDDDDVLIQANANITEVTKVLTSTDQALAEKLSALEVDMSTTDSKLSGAISDLSQVIATDDNVLAQQMAQMEAAFKTSGESSTLTTNAKITTVEKTSADATQALAERVTGLTAQWQKDDANILKSANAAITEATKVLTKEDEALAESLKALEGKVNTGNTELAGSISDLSQVVITTDQALALRVDKVEVAYKDADKETNSSVQSLTQTVTDADQALAKRIDSVDAGYKGADSELSGAITEISEVVATDDNVLAQQMAQMEAAFKAANESATLTTNAKITSVKKTAADANGALAEKIDTVQSTVNDISATVQQNSSAISTINEDGSTAHKAMWATKAQAGDIKAGIGILAKSDGTSQVAVSASQFFVFDPNKAGGETQPLFAIDKGKVVIPTALIESATIQILSAQIITADKVKAGISITSPKIEGAEFLGGWAKFGPGGPYSGYHTYISADGTIKTNRIYAYGGTFSNVVIEDSCIIKGKLTVGQIEGDIFKRYIVNKAYNKFTATHSTSGSFRRVFSITIEPADITRTLIIPTIACYVWGVHRACYARCNGQSYSVDIRHEGTADHVYIDALVPIPASSIEQTVIVEIACWTSGSTSNAEWSISKQDLYVELFKSQIISA